MSAHTPGPWTVEVPYEQYKAATNELFQLRALNAELLAALQDITTENTPSNHRRALEVIAKAEDK